MFEQVQPILPARHPEEALRWYVHERTALRNTTWGTREFAFYDPDGNALTFYRHLRPGEK